MNKEALAGEDSSCLVILLLRSLFFSEAIHVALLPCDFYTVLLSFRRREASLERQGPHTA